MHRDFFWNQSHLLADSLGGDPCKSNLVTGARMQNDGDNDDGALWPIPRPLHMTGFDTHGEETLCYSALPMYEKDELIPRAAIVDMKSPDGQIDAEKIIYKAAKSFSINYSTGAIARQ